jgi:voltage-gated potassium channel
MSSSHGEAREARGTPEELVLTGRGRPLFGVLLIAMLFELTASSFIAMLPGGLAIIRGLSVLVLVAALAVAGSHRFAVVLFAAAASLQVMTSVWTGQFAAVASSTVHLLFLSYVLGLVVWRVLTHRAVTIDTVAGAACAYVLIGLVWGHLFLVVEQLRPGSFHVPPHWLEGPGHTMRAALMYFSFATLTTLGYGDIHPNDPGPGSLCAAEALVGQLYLAIMIARLVGLHASGVRAGDRAPARSGEPP